MKVFKLVKLFTVMNADAVSVSGGDGRQMEENPSEVNESYSCGKLMSGRSATFMFLTI